MMTATAPKIVGASQTREPVYVFGSDLRGDFTQHTAVNAVRLHRADPATLSGGSGNAYAIPYRDAAGAPLGYGALAAHVGAFLRQARACPQDVFHIARFACEADAHDDATMARQFAQAPANCKLPGVWLRELDPHTPMRLLIFDPFARFKDRVWQDKLRRYLALNVSTRSGAVIELVSVGSARSVVANDMAATRLGLNHRVFGANEAYYGREAAVAAEAKAVWYATHFLSLCDVRQTAQPQQMRVTIAATRGGLFIDQLDLDFDD